ncbi:N-acylneuraminate cytidylyltransferase A-like isoform X1 [Girardinichthys multiradiatus]|uniref:N-acylneuraminate cytidylyltransferase A-like isoform X1 n=1 Tax=Girardinichthys multiradiatus TaxID=208333 RepID=UPI001FAD1604|nr:N-acylneuraminate cytidylyltransferase A-like isoform X1 [Girardinichthys multiradiatus]
MAAPKRCASDDNEFLDGTSSSKKSCPGGSRTSSSKKPGHVAALILARGGSKRIPLKNIKTRYVPTSGHEAEEMIRQMPAV